MAIGARLRAGLGRVGVLAGDGVGVLVTFVATIGVALAALAVVAHLMPGWSSTIVSSGSMAPVIRQGDVVVVGQTDAGDIGVGSVIVFDGDDGSQVVHRVVAVEPDGSLRTRGDANQSNDPSPVLPDQVHGRGFLLVPWVGLPRLWWTEGRYGLLAALAVVAVLGVVGGRWSARRAPAASPRPAGSPVRWLLAAPPERGQLVDAERRTRIIDIARAGS